MFSHRGCSGRERPALVTDWSRFPRGISASAALVRLSVQLDDLLTGRRGSPPQGRDQNSEARQPRPAVARPSPSARRCVRTGQRRCGRESTQLLWLPRVHLGSRLLWAPWPLVATLLLTSSSLHASLRADRSPKVAEGKRRWLSRVRTPSHRGKRDGLHREGVGAGRPLPTTPRGTGP